MQAEMRIFNLISMSYAKILTPSLAAGAAATKASSLKTNKYEDLHTTLTIVPIAIETSGCFNQTGLEFITELANRLKHKLKLKLKLAIN